MKQIDYLKTYIKECVKNILQEEKPLWYDEKRPKTKKEDEVEASWNAFKNTYGDDKGHIPTDLNDEDSWEHTKNKWGKEDKNNLWMLPDLDYPSDFTDDTEGRRSMSVLSDNDWISKTNKATWKGKSDKNGRISYDINFDDIVENIYNRISCKIKKQIKTNI